MTVDLTTCRETASGNIITPKGRLSYAQYLTTPQENKQGNLKYSVNILIPKSADLKLLMNKMGAVALKHCDGDQERAKNFVKKRFLDPNDLPGGGKPMGEEFKDFVLVRGTSDYKPQFVYPNGKRIPDEEINNELYSGRWASVSFNPYWSDNQENKGVFLGLQNVQLLDHDENLGVKVPDAEDEFGAVEVDGADSGFSGSPEEANSDVDAMFG